MGNDAREGDKRTLNVSFIPGGHCPQEKTNDKAANGACIYDEEICRVSSGETRIDTVHHKCEAVSEAECQIVQEECDEMSKECLALGEGEEEVQTFCFASFAKDGDTRPLNVVFIPGGQCPKPKD